MSGGAIVSLFRSQTKSALIVRASRIPILHPPEKPRFRLTSMISTCGQASRILRTESLVEALSITMMRRSG